MFQAIEGKKSYKRILALIGYLFYGFGIALFVLGVAFSIFAMLNHPNLPDSKIDGMTVFLNAIIPWIIFSVIFLIVAPIVFRLGTDQEQKILPRNQRALTISAIKDHIRINLRISGAEY